MNTCPECQEKIIGRIDKKFCSDACRNAYNNKRNRDSVNLVRNINNLLRKNRRILESLAPEGKKVVNATELSEKGFNFSYHTHSVETKKNKKYLFVYDYGYLKFEDEKDKYLIVKNEK